MFGETVAEEFGRVILFTGEQRGGPDGGPVCRIVVNGRTGAILDLGRIDCFAVEPHHHTQKPVIDPGLESPHEIRTDLAERGRRLTLPEWESCARRAVCWLREDFVRELREVGWGSWTVGTVEGQREALVEAVERFLLSHPPTGVAA